jgi:hypothetical protein
VLTGHGNSWKFWRFHRMMAETWRKNFRSSAKTIVEVEVERHWHGAPEKAFLSTAVLVWLSPFNSA